MEQERVLAASHEGAHVVMNATKGRRIETVEIYRLDEQGYGGKTCVRSFSDSGMEAGDIIGVVGRKDPTAPLRRAMTKTAGQRAANMLPLEDELVVN